MRNTIIKDPTLEPFYLSKDKYCYTVVEVIEPSYTRGKTPKSTESPSDYEKVVGHYQDLGGALKRIARERLTTPTKEYNSVREYLNRFEELKEEMKLLLNKLEL